MDWVMIITGLIGALVVSSYKVCRRTHLHENLLTVVTVGILRFRQRRLVVHHLQCRLGCEQPRQSPRSRRPPHLPNVWCLDSRPLDPIPDCMGSL